MPVHPASADYNEKQGRQRSIKGWEEPQIRQVLSYLFKSCFISCHLKRGSQPVFVCVMAQHTDKAEIADFKSGFLQKNKIPMHFTYLVDEPYEGETNRQTD